MTKAPDGGFIFRETLKSYDGSRWTVIEGSGLTARDAVENLYDGYLEMFPDEIGPLLQKRDKNYTQITETAQYAFAERVAKAKEYFAKNVVKDRLGGREIDDEDPETDNRSRRRSRDEDEPREERRSRRDDDGPPARQSRSYGDDADEPDNAPRCDHGKMVRREGTSAKGPWSGWFCPLPRERSDEQCSPQFDKKKGGYRR